MSRALPALCAVVVSLLAFSAPVAAQNVSGNWVWAAPDGVNRISVQLVQSGAGASGTLTFNESTIPVRGYMIATLLMAKLGVDGKEGKFRANVSNDGSLFSEIIAPDPNGGKDLKLRFTLVRAAYGVTADGLSGSLGGGGTSLAERALQKMRGSELIYMKEEYYGFDKSIFLFCTNGRYAHGRENGSWQVVDRGGRAFLILTSGFESEEREITMDSDQIVYLDGKQFNRSGPAGC